MGDKPIDLEELVVEPSVPKMFIIITTYKVPVEVMLPDIEAHREFLKRYAQKGIFLTAGPRFPYNGGIAVAHNVTREQIDDIFHEDPFWQKHDYDYQVYEFEPKFFIP